MKQTNKRRQQTEALLQATAKRRMADNDVEQHRFDKLIECSVLNNLYK